MATEEDLQRARAAKARYGKELLANPDVHGVGVGYRRRDGEKTDEVAIVVHVQHKREKEKVDPRNLLPETVRLRSRDGEDVEIRVDVVEKPIPVEEVACGDCPADLEDRVRPVPGGYSGGPPTNVSNGGTLGGWIWDNVTDQAVVISNDHVFGGTAGTDISQPSTFDGGSLPADRIADVVRNGTLDVSIASPSADDIALYEIECGGPGVFEITDATLEMEVQKTGQTTGLTCGIVELIDYDSGHYGSHDDLWIDGDGDDFSMGGDSGSLYLEKSNPSGAEWRRVVGIHWGGSGDDGVGHPIRAVFDDLDATTLCSGWVSEFLESVFGRSTEREAERFIEVVPAEASDLRSARGLGTLVRPWLRLSPSWLRRPRRQPFGRTIEARVAELERGKKVVDAVQRNRVTVVRVLRHTDGRRAATALLKPVSRSVTTDDLLNHRITGEDLENVDRLLAVVQRIGGDSAEDLIKVARSLIDRASAAEGVTIGKLLA